MTNKFHDDIVDVFEAARMIGCTEQYVYKLANQGKIIGHKHRAGWWFTMPSVKEFAVDFRARHGKEDA